jgi:O-phospho-L-seryl-tRNASec:L-selenocysteinyl-tRNA synthase
MESIIKKLGKIYAGRASSAPIIDLFITLLSMGIGGYKHLLEQRNALIPKFQQRFAEIAQSQGERILHCPKNTISFGITLDTLARSDGDDVNDQNIMDDKKKAEITSLFGSMLFTRCVSGTRVVAKNQTKVIEGQEFIGFGSSNDDYPHSYLTAACAIGLTEGEMEEFFVRLEKCFKDFRTKRKKALAKEGKQQLGNY